MTDEEKAVEIFRVTVDKTKKKQLGWELSQDLGPGDVFESKTPAGFILRAFPFTNLDEEEEPSGPATLTLYDDDSKIVFDITANLPGVTAQELEDLYQAARRTAFKIDAKLDAILKDLDTLSSKVDR